MANIATTSDGRRRGILPTGILINFKVCTGWREKKRSFCFLVLFRMAAANILMEMLTLIIMEEEDVALRAARKWYESFSIVRAKAVKR